jgi:hypothetical protein
VPAFSDILMRCFGDRKNASVHQRVQAFRPS